MEPLRRSPSKPIWHSRADHAISLVEKDNCCIPQDYLVKYGILTNIETSGTIKRLLDQYDLKDIRSEQLYTSVQKDDNTHKIFYFINPLLFKFILIRSKNTMVYAKYYLLLEMCIKYYNDYYQLKLKKRIEEDNKIKLLLLTESETLDNFTIYRCDQDTLYVRKNPHGKGLIYTHHDYEEYPYALINGSNKNVAKIIKLCNIKENNKVIRLKCPSYNNFIKKIREIMSDKFERKITEYEDCADDNTSRTSVTRFFKLNNIIEDEFIKELNKIHVSRGIQNEH